MFGMFYLGFFLLSGVTCLWEYVDGGKKQFSIITFRTHQIIEVIFNDALSRRIYPVVLFSVAIIGIYLGFVLVCMRSYIPWPEFAIVPVGVVDNIAAFTIITIGPVKIYRATEFTLAAAKATVGISGQRFPINLRRRELWACRPLRIKLFGNNFIDPRTPLVIGNFCLEECGSLILLFGTLRL